MWKSCENGNFQEKTTNSSSSDSQITSGHPGPNEAKIKAILDRTKYTLQVTAGQRKYGGPPPDWHDNPPSLGCEIFVGKIPKDVYEDELIPLFEKIGKLWDLRLMIDPISNHSRGYAFITYCNKEDAQRAVQELNGHKIRPKGYSIKVNISVPNLRLFIGNIPKVLSKDQIFNEFNKVTDGLVEVIIYSSPDDRKKNRGFCFLEFDSHKNASAAKRKLTSAGMKLFKSDILVDWADPQEEPDEETMSKVKVLYVRNLTSDVAETELKELFEEFGPVERVKKIKDYAFIHFEDRQQALEAMENLNGKEFGGSGLEISLAKPPSDRRKKEEMLRNREKRMVIMMQQKQMMAYPRVPQSQVRPPIASIPPLPATILPNRNNRNRFPQPINTFPLPFNRQNSMWNPLGMLYDDWFYGSNRPGPQLNFNSAPQNPQWNYGLANGLVSHMPAYCPNINNNNNNRPNRRSGPNGNTNAVLNTNPLPITNNGNVTNNYCTFRKWKSKPSNQNISLSSNKRQ